MSNRVQVHLRVLGKRLSLVVLLYVKRYGPTQSLNHRVGGHGGVRLKSLVVTDNQVLLTSHQHPSDHIRATLSRFRSHTVHALTKSIDQTPTLKQRCSLASQVRLLHVSCTRSKLTASSFPRAPGRVQLVVGFRKHVRVARNYPERVTRSRRYPTIDLVILYRQPWQPPIARQVRCCAIHHPSPR